MCKAVWPLILVASTLAVILTNFLTAFSFPYLAALPFKITLILATQRLEYCTAFSLLMYFFISMKMISFEFSLL